MLMKKDFACAEKSVGIKHCICFARMANELIENCFRCMELFKFRTKKKNTQQEV